MGFQLAFSAFFNGHDCSNEFPNHSYYAQNWFQTKTETKRQGLAFGLQHFCPSQTFDFHPCRIHCAILQRRAHNETSTLRQFHPIPFVGCYTEWTVVMVLVASWVDDERRERYLVFSWPDEGFFLCKAHGDLSRRLFAFLWRPINRTKFFCVYCWYRGRSGSMCRGAHGNEALDRWHYRLERKPGRLSPRSRVSGKRWRRCTTDGLECRQRFGLCGSCLRLHRCTVCENGVVEDIVWRTALEVGSSRSNRINSLIISLGACPIHFQDRWSLEICGEYRTDVMHKLGRRCADPYATWSEIDTAMRYSSICGHAFQFHVKYVTLNHPLLLWISCAQTRSIIPPHEWAGCTILSSRWCISQGCTSSN